VPGEDLLEPVQRKVVGVLADSHVREKAFGGETFLDGLDG
jgi:hypothetical protein